MRSRLKPRPAVPETRSMVAQSDPEFLQAVGMWDFASTASDVLVNEDTALGVPAVFSAVNFIAGTIAGLPLNLFKRSGDGDRKRVTDTPLALLLHDAVNDGLSSFEWRKSLLERVLLAGRGLTFIERNGAGLPVNFWPLDPKRTTIKVQNNQKTYEYRQMGGGTVVYTASEIIDIPFMLKSDGFTHRSPITTNRDVIALGIAATQFGSKFFQNGGVPPFAITGPFQSGSTLGRAADDITAAVRKAAKEKRQALVLPAGLDIKPIGSDAQKSQLIELKQFIVEEVCRIYGLPPIFVQDMTHGTYSNTEQQDLQLSKHTIKRWVEHLEQELNLKLFGRANRRFFVEFNMDGLMRGDFASRMQGHATAINNGIETPNEARQIENKPPLPNGDSLMIQGATVPLGSQPEAAPITPPIGGKDGA